MTSIEQAMTLIDATLEKMTLDMDDCWVKEEDPTEEIRAQIYMAADTYRRVYHLLERCHGVGAGYIVTMMADNKYLTNDIYEDFHIHKLEWYTGAFEDITFLYNKYDEALKCVRFFLSVGTNLPK